ncbi:MAG: hypothetical protein C0597_15740 [Marinilabiliales bacterium]|nr:MAG: hypothetical protein C0597_15740 [Marinilabiliales bacterium]
MSRVDNNVDLEDKLDRYKQHLLVQTIQDTEQAEVSSEFYKPLIKPAEGMYFHSNPSLLVWIFVISAFMTISIGLMVPYITRMLETIRRSKVSARYVAVVLISIVGLGLITFFLHEINTSFLTFPVQYKTAANLLSDFDILLKNPDHTIKIAIGVMFLAAFTGMAGLLILNKAIDNIKYDTVALKSNVEQSLDQFNMLRIDLKFYLYTLSLLVAGSILTTGMLRESILTVLPRANDFLFPIEFVYLYGLSFSLILIIAYVPIFSNLKRKSQQIVLGIDELSDAYEPLQLKSIKERLSVQTTIFDNIKVVISLLAPLITSFLPNFM